MPFKFDNTDEAKEHRIEAVRFDEVLSEVRNDCVRGLADITLMMEFVPNGFPERFGWAIRLELAY